MPLHERYARARPILAVLSRSPILDCRDYDPPAGLADGIDEEAYLRSNNRHTRHR